MGTGGGVGRFRARLTTPRSACAGSLPHAPRPRGSPRWHARAAWDRLWTVISTAMRAPHGAPQRPAPQRPAGWSSPARPGHGRCCPPARSDSATASPASRPPRCASVARSGPAPARPASGRWCPTTAPGCRGSGCRPGRKRSVAARTSWSSRPGAGEGAPQPVPGPSPAQSPGAPTR